jgi:hypothetical protein
MNVRKLPSGSYEARLMVNGVRYSATVPTREDAQDWIKVVRARAVTGGLPRRITVEQYSSRWMTTYDGPPTRPRPVVFHQGKPRPAHPAVPRLALGGRRHADRHLPLNGLKARVSSRPPTRSTGPVPHCSTPRSPTTSWSRAP